MKDDQWDLPPIFGGYISRSKQMKYQNMASELRRLDELCPPLHYVVDNNQRIVLFRPKHGPWVDFFPSTGRFRVVGPGKKTFAQTFDGDVDHVVDYIWDQIKKLNL